MKIYILGSTGMLGRYVSTYLENKNFSVHKICRKDMDLSYINESILESFLNLYKDDIVINCAGTIKPRVDELGVLNALLVNSVVPYRLANICEKNRAKMIHITTDCVFTGGKGNYTEEDEHDVTDVYGRTKSLGEPENCTIIRTSIIGEEIGQSRSLIEWIKSCKNKKVNGFLNHYWNGVTCLQLAKIINEMIEKNIWWNSVRHIYSNSVNKYELLTIINDIYELNVEIKDINYSTSCDRTLSSIYNLDFNIPHLDIQIKELKNFQLTA